MSEPKAPEGNQPETPQTSSPRPEAANDSAPRDEAGGAAGGPETMKPEAYVDPEVLAEAHMAAWEAEKAELTDRLMRVHAEMDNLRKRTEREKADISKYAVTRFAGDMVAVVDNLERALAAMPRDAAMEPQTKALVEGVDLTAQDLRKALERNNVLRLDALNQIFDPNFHQAVMEEENKEVAAGTVVRVLQEGYRIGDRVLRPSMVVVARGGFKPVKPAADAAAGGDDGAGDPATESGQPG